MTRMQIVLSLKEDVRKKFLFNLVDCNISADFSDQWLNSEDPNRTTGICGAFPWSVTKEGFNYWSRIHANLKSK